MESLPLVDSFSGPQRGRSGSFLTTGLVPTKSANASRYCVHVVGLKEGLVRWVPTIAQTSKGCLYSACYLAHNPSITNHLPSTPRALAGDSTLAEYYAFCGMHHIFDKHSDASK